MDKRARAQHAERLLNDDVLQEAFNVVKGYHTEVFRHPNSTDEEILMARRDLMALERVIGQIRSFVTDGKMIEKKEQHRVID